MAKKSSSSSPPSSPAKEQQQQQQHRITQQKRNGNNGSTNDDDGPPGWEHRTSVQVYILPTKTATSKYNDDIQRPASGQQKCYWLGEYHAQSPSEMWTFPKGEEPKDLKQHNLHGLYGHNHGKQTTLWFLPPGAAVPSSFRPLGTWTFPLEKRNIEEIEPEQSGFLKMGQRHQGNERLDVSGQWRLLYKRDGEDKPINIFVRTPKGKLIDLVVEPDDMVNTIKNMVRDREGFPKKDIRLKFNNKPLNEPTATVDDCGIQDQDILDMEPMKVRVKDVDGKVHTFVVDPTDTVGSLKKQIQRDEGTPVPQQRLFFGPKTELKQNQPTLRDVGIEHNDMLHLEPMQVHVTTLDNKTLTFDVKPTDTIQSIKKKVESKENIPLSEQRLEFKGKQLDDPSSTLNDNGIKHNDTMNLTPMVIYVMTPDKKKIVTLNVRPVDTIQDVKEQVMKKENIPVKHQRLNFNGRTLDDEPHKTLRSNGIHHGDTLNLTPMRIHVRLPDSKRITLVGVKPNDTIGHVKTMIDDRESISPSDQRLFFMNQRLNDDKSTLDHCGIQHDDTLDLKERPKSPPPSPTKPLVTPVTPQKKKMGPEYTIGLSPWKDPFASPTGYTPKKKKSRDGTRATGAGRLKGRYHTDFNSELHEIGLMAEERHHLKKLDEQSIAEGRGTTGVAAKQ